jgi:tetratricopeptide (TPR) repeat protein
MNSLRISCLFAALILFLSPLRAQDSKIVADNLEFSREFYSGVHFSAIAKSAPSFAYQRYPDNGPERIQCDKGTFARKQHGKPWLKSQDWGESGTPVDAQTARKLDAWVKLVDAVFNFAPNEVELVGKSEEQGRGRVQWIFDARAKNQKEPIRLTFARPLYDKNPNALLHGFEGPLRVDGEKSSRAEPVKFSFGYLISVQGGYELSERAWEDLQTPKEEKSNPINLSKIDMGPKPQDAEGFVNRGSARGFNGDVNGAIADFGRAIELDPKLTSAFYDRGIARLQKSDSDGAIADLNRAIELSPKTGDYYNDRGLAKLRKSDNDGAIADLTRAIELDPKNALAYRNRALAKNIKKDEDGALADYDRAIELDPKNANAYNNRGNIKQSKGDFDGAIADFTSAIGLNSNLAIAYKNRGEAKQAKGDLAGAKEDLKRAGELDPELVGKESRAADKSPSPAAQAPPAGGTTVALLDDKLKLDLPPDFSRDPDDPKDPKTLAKFSGPDSAWGAVLRGTHGLTPDQLEGYLKMRVAEYSKGFKWLPKDSHLQWLKKEIVTIDGRKWADWSFVPVLKGKKDYSHNPVYTRNLTTSYRGQLLEINFTSNLNTNPELKREIDHIMESVHLEE